MWWESWPVWAIREQLKPDAVIRVPPGLYADWKGMEEDEKLVLTD